MSSVSGEEDSIALYETRRGLYFFLLEVVCGEGNGGGAEDRPMLEVVGRTTREQDHGSDLEISRNLLLPSLKDMTTHFL